MKYLLYICFLFLANSVFPRSQEKKYNGQASLYTEQHITDIYMTNPDSALLLLDEAEEKKLMLPVQINDLRSMVYRHKYQCKLAFHYARKAYVQDSIASNNPERLLKTTIMLAELSSLLSEYEVSNRYVVEGVRLARNINDKQAEVRLLFCMGENKRRLSFKKEAYETFDEAIRLLSDADNIYGLRTLSYFTGVKMSFLIDDGLIDDALTVGLYRQRLLEKMERTEGVQAAYLDLQKSYLYSKLAYLYYRLGDKRKAEECFAKYKSTKAASTPAGKYDATPYLLLAGQYQEILDNCRDLKNVFREQDTVNYQYRGVLSKEIMAYTGLGKYKRAVELSAAFIALTDSIHQREKTNAALELDALYDADEKERHIAEQASQLRIRTISLVFICLLVLLALFFLWKVWLQNRNIKDKNRTLMKYINEELSEQNKKSQSFEETDNGLLQDELDMEPADVGQEYEINKLVFQKLDSQIRREELYLSADLSREDLVRMARMNNTRFAKMIKENTGTNLNGYINELRLNHAIQLLKEHPEYTLRAIAEASGINSMPTFHNLFKSKTGMTPSEFKKVQMELK
ncbi:helix-turn-helix domain-containing protein [Bacteroides sp. AM10-21B]|uniref:helix-turn-helix domain-containing protein n=1 Tax=Bacteroides sp. AM10-21B TaxID=2292001 RepID=UPI000E4AA5C3|nr:helix-turn-helix transcriptional regulator [Bacteroides sp. AM10-21B]RHJ53182.1 AraC family transcriptional regulator [Bacteroides sp. AM10-21B]